MDVSSIGNCRILVIGDVMVDDFIYGTAAPKHRLSPEAPVPVIMIQKNIRTLGGSCNVVANLVAIGCSVDLCGLVGDDPMRDACLEMLEGIGVSTELLVKSDSPTIVKTRVICDNQHIVRLDREKEFDAKHSQPLCDKLSTLAPDEYDAIIISDYAKGTISPPLMHFVIQHFADCRILVDPKPEYGRDQIDLYRGVTCITPNLAEARMMVTDHSASAEDVAVRLGGLLDCDFIVVTMSEHGALLSDSQITIIPAHSVNLSDASRPQKRDVTGAGDTLISTLAACLSHGFSPYESVFAANVAAGIVVNKMGTAVCSLPELQKEIDCGEEVATDIC